ncbi:MULTISPECIES: hypothetical protein [Streptomyces]|jgi:hypothetical protein|uniref:Uncharacterized protein n=2 Tax=Streptomyces TaxID=1883 RepID=A0ABT9LR51_STRGD|nr:MULTISPECIES: hypothetical protein [Streptomyces]MDP9686025.1 hypothetical protein [Streptomyces griseoviridis]GGS78861.1 hypothetical protein GCM10010240_10130 [Streptomyces griseoviridis]GGU16283.1 hypothetical protein GCM10010259_03310 [Streptomyces daghestanicus]GHI35312.1 hypothetical protein Sdagh_70420 [Streptomyces daghestanicus]
MFGRSKPLELNVLVLRDADVIATALRTALAAAAPEERPGLERAAALVEQAAAVPDAALRARWVHERLTAAGHEGPVDSVRAVKTLRESVPGLGLLSAVQLTKDAAAHRP